MHADVSGVPISLTQVGDAVALGSSMLAAVGAGLYPDIQTAAENMVHEIDRLEPNQERHEEYQFYLKQYMAGYPQMQELIHATVDHESQA